VKRYVVAIEPGAERDLADIVEYIADRDSVDRAAEIASRIDRRIAVLETFPNRGAHPKELLEYGNRDFREVYYQSYRILYRVLEREVVVVLIADGRRDMRTLLTRRLLNG
jgi:toxin ParE1/3/4